MLWGALLFSLIIWLLLSYLPAILIFFWLDRYRPGLYQPRKRWLRFVVYLGVLIVTRFMLRQDGHIPLLLSVLAFYVLPVPLYYLLRKLF